MAKDKHFDRIKAIKRLSRKYAGPYGKAGPHVDKRQRRELRRRSTQEWLAEAEEETAVMYRVRCDYLGPDDETHFLGSVVVEAADEKGAISAAMDRVWDPRLDAAGCVPDFWAEELEVEDEEE